MKKRKIRDILRFVSITVFILSIVVYGFITNAKAYSHASPVLVETEINKPQFQLEVSPHSTYLVNKEINLSGQKLVLPEGVTLKFAKGFFTNGEIVGNGTKISEKSTKIFDRVTISGTWNVPKISTAMFRDLSYDNALRDVVALSDPAIHNIITIDKGDYVAKTTGNIPALSIRSNTDVILNGTIKLKSNELSQYYIVNLSGANINLRGSGQIIGDKFSHTGTKGEWGMGVNVSAGENIVISDITIKECWGDCIYVGDSSKNVTIDNCSLIDGRRQGISVTSANGVTIKNCNISNVNGTEPQYAIDIEPNKSESVDNVLIDNVKAINCFGGFQTFGYAQGARIGTVTLRNSSVERSKSKYPIRLMRGEEIIIENCYINSDDRSSVLIQEIENVIANNNTLKSANSVPFKVIQCKKATVNNSIIVK